jgi:hypothetical protein
VIVQREAPSPQARNAKNSSRGEQQHRKKRFAAGQKNVRKAPAERSGEEKRYTGARQQLNFFGWSRSLTGKGFLWNHETIYGRKLVAADHQYGVRSDRKPLFIVFLADRRDANPRLNRPTIVAAKRRSARASIALPGISTTGEQDLPALATLWAYLTQKHRDNAGPELLNNPAVIEAARDG